MAEVIPFRKPSSADKTRASTLCRHGHHRWLVDKAKEFDVKQGKLVTVYRCERCGKQKVLAH